MQRTQSAWSVTVQLNWRQRFIISTDTSGHSSTWWSCSDRAFQPCGLAIQMILYSTTCFLLSSRPFYMEIEIVGMSRILGHNMESFLDSLSPFCTLNGYTISTMVWNLESSRPRLMQDVFALFVILISSNAKSERKTFLEWLIEKAPINTIFQECGWAVCTSNTAFRRNKRRQ